MYKKSAGIACPNTPNNSSGTSTDSTSTTAPIVNPPITNFPDTITPIYNTLSIFTQQGATWNFIRIDSITCSPYLGNPSYNPYRAKWQYNLKGDSLYYYDSIRNSKVVDGVLYKDSTYETFTIRGTISIGELKAIFNDPTTRQYDNPYFNYMANTLLVSDTEKCSILLINNTTRNMADTEYVYLSKQYFAIIPKGGCFGLYGNKDMSLISFGLNLSKIKPAGSSFIYNDKIYTADMGLSALLDMYNSSFDRYYNCELFLSQKNGLLKNYIKAYDDFYHVSSFHETTLRINTSNN